MDYVERVFRESTESSSLQVRRLEMRDCGSLRWINASMQTLF